MSICTGSAETKEHEAWNAHKNPAPMEAPLLFSTGAPLVSKVMRELLQITLADSVTETQDTNAIAESAISRFASFVRLNPLLTQKTWEHERRRPNSTSLTPKPSSASSTMPKCGAHHR